jgi:hypothetical protein
VAAAAAAGVTAAVATAAVFVCICRFCTLQSSWQLMQCYSAYIHRRLRSLSSACSITGCLSLTDSVVATTAPNVLQHHSVNSNTSSRPSPFFAFADQQPFLLCLQNHTFILDPPSIIFIARLHLTSVARRKYAAAAGRGIANGSSSSSQKQPSRIPPPVELPEWAQQQQAEHLAAAGHGSSSNGASKDSSRGQQPSRRSHDSSGSSSSAAGGSRGDTAIAGSAAAAAAAAGGRRLDDAPDLLCCPITGQVGVSCLNTQQRGRCSQCIYCCSSDGCQVCRCHMLSNEPAYATLLKVHSRITLLAAFLGHSACIISHGTYHVWPSWPKCCSIMLPDYGSRHQSCHDMALFMLADSLVCVLACCLQIMLQPVSLPSGKTFEVRRAADWKCLHLRTGIATAGRQSCCSYL